MELSTGNIDGLGMANELPYWVDSNTLGSLAVATYPSLTELSYVKGVTSAIQTQLNTKLSTLTIGSTTITSGVTTRILYDNAGVLGEYTLTGSGTVVAMATSPTFQTSINGAYLTASEILITDGSKNIVSAAVATYPSLTELTYLKGVTSAIQTQFTGKANTALSNLASVAINTTLVSDTDNTDDLGTSSVRWANIYAVNLGATGTRISAGWFTNLTVTNTISGAVSGNAGTATALQNARTIGGVSFDGTANITVATATGGFTVSGGALALGTQDLTMTGSLAATGARVTKGWFTDIESTNMPTVGGTSLSSTFAPIASPTFTGLVTTPAIKITTGAGSGKVLTSDADGDATWEDPTGGGSTALTLIPYPAAPELSISNIQLATNTTAHVGQIVVPFGITVNKISIRTQGTHTTAGVADITLYAEDGQSQLFSVTTDSLAAADTLYTTAVSAVSVPAGVYYLMINPNGTMNVRVAAWAIETAPFSVTAGLPYDVASEPVMFGTLTITAGTPPATFDPTAILQNADTKLLICRLDN